MGYRVIHKKLYAIVFVAAFLLTSMYGGTEPVAAMHLGAIMSGDIEYYKAIHEAFLHEMGDELQKGGHEVLLQKPMPDAMSWVNAAKKLVTFNSEIIVAYGVPAALISMKEAPNLPVIYAGAYDPKTLRMTGKNATGVESTVSIKDTIRQLMSIKKISKLGVLFSKAEKDTILQVKKIQKLQKSLGFKMVVINAKKRVDKSKITGIDGLIITSSSVCMNSINDIVSASRAKKIPTAALIGGGEDAGILLTVSADPKEQGKRLADTVRKVLGGTKPSDIPVASSDQVTVVINMKEAADMGVDVPGDLQSKATRVIQ